MVKKKDMMEFYGDHLTPKEYELLSMRVDPVHREDEAGLVHTRWFDYCKLHPAAATYLFADIYKRHTKEFHESYVDIRTAEDARAFTPDDIFMSRDLTAMWLARRTADAHGLPYDFVMWFAKQRALARTFQRFPRPNQLYGEEFEIDLKAAWQEKLDSSLRYSRHETFKVHNRVGNGGSFFQKKHGIFVVEQIKRRPSKVTHANLLARMFHERVLDKQMVQDHFDESVIETAELNATQLAVSHH